MCSPDLSFPTHRFSYSPTPIERLETGSFESLNELKATPGVAHRPQVYDLRSLQEGDTTVYSLVTPLKAGSPPAPAGGIDTVMSYSIPSSMLENAGKQDEVIRLKAALNEKDMELIELREQHMQLVARSQEARSNWETALEAKDRAIGQLEEALASRQRALEAASRQAAAAQEQAAANIAAAHARAQALEASLAEAHAINALQQHTLAEEQKQLQAAKQAAGQEEAAGEARIRALQQELASTHLQHDNLEREVKQLKALTAEKDGRLANAAAKEQQLQQQMERLKRQLQETETQLLECPAHDKEQLAELSKQLEVVQRRAAAKEASSRKYKDAVRAFKAKLQERDEALALRQAQILELHTELSQLQRLLKMGPPGGLRNAAAAVMVPSCSPRASGYSAGIGGGPYSPNKGGSGSVAGHGSAEDVVVAATDELERLRVEVHGFHLELEALHCQLHDKDSLLQQALSDAAALDAERAAAAARAEEATQAVFNLERQLRASQETLQECEQAKITVSEKLVGAEARLEGLQADQTSSIRNERELRAQLQGLQGQLAAREQEQAEAKEQLKVAQQREADATRRIRQLEARAQGLEARLDESLTETGQATRRADRHEAATASLQAQLDAAISHAKESEQAVQDADSRLRDNSRHLTEVQQQQQELAKHCEAAEQAKQQLEAQAAAAEARAAAADKRCSDLESQLSLLGRSLRDAEGAAMDWQDRARQADGACQELHQMLAGNETAVKQLQSDLAQMQLSTSSERSQDQQQLAQLRSTLQEAQTARTLAEAAQHEAERRLGEVQGALDSQERLLVALREQVSEAGHAVQRVSELEDLVQDLKAALAEQQRTVSQCQAAVAATERQQQATVAELLAGLAEKSGQLVHAERRFSQLEGLMQRIAARTGQSPANGFSSNWQFTAVDAFEQQPGVTNRQLTAGNLHSQSHSWDADALLSKLRNSSAFEQLQQRQQQEQQHLGG